MNSAAPPEIEQLGQSEAFSMGGCYDEFPHALAVFVDEMGAPLGERDLELIELPQGQVGEEGAKA